MIPPPTIRRIEQLSDEEEAYIANMCARVYEAEDEPITLALVGGRHELIPLLFTAIVRACDLEGHIYVLEVNGKMVSVTCWFPPGNSLWKSEAQRTLGFNELMEKVDEETRSWWTDTYRPIVAEFLKKNIPIPYEDLWWTNILATETVYQGHGYATMLMSHVLKEISSSRVPAHAGLATTSEKNEQCYNGIGYPTVGRTSIPSKFGNVPVYAFVREV